MVQNYPRKVNPTPRVGCSHVTDDRQTDDTIRQTYGFVIALGKRNVVTFG